MPGVMFHLGLADFTLERWDASGMAPFDVRDPRCRAAFGHGALGPDIGYFPGGDVLLSELAHRVRTGGLATRLLRGASDDVEIAFACGWITHVHADVHLHPLVEVEAARVAHGEIERLAGTWHGSRSPVDLAHVRIEVGIDAMYLGRDPMLGRRLPPVFDAASLGFLAEAFNETYGYITSATEMHAAHAAVSHWHRCLVPLIRWMTADWTDGSAAAARLVAPLLRAKDGGWVRYVGAGPVAAAFVSPLPPSPALLDRFDRARAQIADAVDAVVLRHEPLRDEDLEDGHRIRENEPKPGTSHTLSSLAERISARVSGARPSALRVA